MVEPCPNLTNLELGRGCPTCHHVVAVHKQGGPDNGVCSICELVDDVRSGRIQLRE
jgi:hypothetical protein